MDFAPLYDLHTTSISVVSNHIIPARAVVQSVHDRVQSQIFEVGFGLDGNCNPAVESALGSARGFIQRNVPRVCHQLCPMDARSPFTEADDYCSSERPDLKLRFLLVNTVVVGWQKKRTRNKRSMVNAGPGYHSVRAWFRPPYRRLRLT